MKTAVKTKAKKTNNQASFGGSILKANMEVEAAIELGHDLDETGMPCVFIGVGLLGVLLGFPHARFLQTCTLGPSVQSAPDVHFKK